MIAVHLHGPLAKQFGKVWELEIGSVGEAVRAIDRLRGGFCDAIMDLSEKGMAFRVTTSRGQDLDNDTVAFPLRGVERVDIIPIVQGSSAAVRFVVGAIMVAVAIAIAPQGGLAGPSQVLFSMGASLMLGSVIEWLTPIPKTKDNSASGAQSWSINGPTNTVDQGLPVPLAYGEVLAGAYTVSAGISVATQTPAGSVAPTARIGGVTQLVYGDKAGAPRTVVVRLSAGSLAIAEPYTYTWSLGTFAGATHTRLLNDADKGTCSVEITLTPVANTVSTVTGTVNVTVAGKEVNPAGGAAPANVNANASVSISVSIYGVP